jgi:hypothetical protein
MVHETDMGCIYGFSNRFTVRACDDTDIRLERVVVLEEAWWLVITRKHYLRLLPCLRSY